MRRIEHELSGVSMQDADQSSRALDLSPVPYGMGMQRR